MSKFSRLSACIETTVGGGLIGSESGTGAGRDSRALEADHQIAFPVPWDGTVGGLGWAFAGQRTSGVTCAHACWRARLRGTRSARPVRRQATSSRLRTPRLCT